MTKAEVVSRVINKIIHKTITENQNIENIGKRLFFDAIGYGDFAYPLGNTKDFSPLQEVGAFSKDHLWISPKSDGGANLYMALRRAIKKIEKWTTQYPDSFPPTVIHITEFRYHDADDSTMVQLANELKFQSTSNGNVLFFNVIVTDKEDGNTLYFPSNKYDLKDSYYGEMYYLFSSRLPLSYNEKISCYHSDDNQQEPMQGLAFMVPFNNLEKLLLSILPSIQ